MSAVPAAAQMAGETTAPVVSESRIALPLPLSAVALFGGAFLFVRRRRGRRSGELT